MSETTAIAIRAEDKREPKRATEIDRNAFEPRDWVEAAKVAEALSRSGMLPRSIQRPEAALAILIQGRELGLTVMQSLRSIYVVDGKPTLSAQLMHALCLRHPACEYFALVEASDQSATWETKRRGAPTPVRVVFSRADAERAGLAGKDNWKKYPRQMLSARACSELARAVYPDAVGNLYDPDELGAETTPQGEVHAEPVVVGGAIEEPAKKRTKTEQLKDRLAQKREAEAEAKTGGAAPEPAHDPETGEVQAPAAGKADAAVAAIGRKLASLIGRDGATRVWRECVLQPPLADGETLLDRARQVMAEQEDAALNEGKE